MITINNLFKNKNIQCLQTLGAFGIYEHISDLSNNSADAQRKFFMHAMNVRKRQLLCDVSKSSVRVQAGAMQWMTGKISSETGLGSGGKAIGGFLKGAVKGLVTGESAVKPIYEGNGFVMLEPTERFILLEDVSKWGKDGIVVEDGMFLACETSVEEKVIMRKSLSAALGGGEGLFNLSLKGSGIVALESYVPREELIEFELEDDVVKIDGNMAIAWSGSLDFTVERSSKSLVGSLINGEGLVNVYRGTGRILMAPTIPGTEMSDSNSPKKTGAVKGIMNAVGKLTS